MPEAPLYSSDAPLYGGQVVNATYAPPGAAAGMPPPVPLTGKIVTVVAPDGRVFGLDEAHMPDAIAQGYRAETPDEAGIREEVAKNKGWKGSALVAAHHFADAATFGVFDPLAKSQMDPYERAKFEAVEKDHRAAGIIGELGGFGASLFYGGEFAKGAEAAGGLAERVVMRRAATEVVAHKLEQSALEAGVKLTAKEAAVLAPGLARSIAGSAARMGTEAAVFAAPKAVTEAALGDPEHAAETLAYNLGAGAVLGGLWGMGKGAIRALDSGLGSGTIKSAARDLAAKQAINSNNLVRKFSDRIAAVSGGEKAAGEIALAHDWLPRVEGLGVEDAERYASRLKSDVAEKGAQVSGAWKSLDGIVGGFGGAPAISRDALIGDMRASMGHAVGGIESIGVESVARRGDEFLASAEKKLPEALTFEEAHKFRQHLDDLIKWKPGQAVEEDTFNGLKMGFRNAVSDAMMSGAETYGAAVGEDMIGAIRKFNQEYQVGVTLRDAAKYNVARGMSNRRHSLTDYLGNIIGTTAGGFIGGGLGAAAGGYVGGQANQWLRTAGPSVAARVLDRMGDRVESGLALAERSLAHAGTELERIPSTLETAMRSATAKTLPANAIAHFLGEPPGTSRQDSYETLRDRVGAMAADPARLTQATSAIVERMGSDIPNIQAAYATQTARIVDHIQQILPKNPHAPVMFGPPDTGWKPSKAQLDTLEDRIGVITDPFSVMRRWSDQTLTQPEVETLKTIYPKLADAMKQRIMGAAAGTNGKPPPVLEGGHRLKLGLLLGAPVDPDQAKMTAFFQDAHRADFAGGQEKGNVGTKLSAKRLPELQTATQRVAMKG